MNSVQTANGNHTGIFCRHGKREIQLSASGLLADKRLAVKDLFAIQGEKNAAGNPDWFEQSKPAEKHAYAVMKMLHAGAKFVGLTHTDELAYSLEGNNAHYGQAENPALPGHACGGSSMGSAAAVANFDADIGLGTDTGGSIRVPASYCGLFGIRPSHGVINHDGLIPLAPAFDTTGWFTKNSDLLTTVGQILLPQQPVNTVRHLLVNEAFLDLVDSDLADLLSNKLDQIAPYFKSVKTFSIPDESIIDELADTFRILQGREISRTHGQWVSEQKPNLSPAIAQRMEMAMSLNDSDEQSARQTQQKWTSIVTQNLADNAVLFLPTTPTIAPQLGTDTAALRMRILTLTAIAGLSGSAQVHLPHLTANASGQMAPYGYSLMMSAHKDKSLLNLVNELSKDQESQIHA